MQLFVEHLSVIDSSLLHPVRGLIGESWIVDLTLHGELDDQSMVMDFGPLKKQLKAAIDDSLDHKLLVPTQAKQLQSYQEEEAGRVALRWQSEQGEGWQYECAEQAVVALDTQVISDAVLIAALQQRLMQVVPETVQQVEIGLRHEPQDIPYFHYSHGLKKHDGNCQRMAHGHRSRLMIWRNGTLDEQAMRQWCEEWRDVYLLTHSDITASATDSITSEYLSPQGHFTLTMPRQRAIVLSTDSTIECIASHIADRLHEREPGAHWKVRVYEGVHKGAQAVRNRR